MLIHVTGASGSGTSTLGKALAGELGGAFLDADDFFWAPSDPPFQARRPVEERRSLLLTEFSRSDIAMRSGSVTAWGVEIEDVFDFIVFLYVDTALRLERLRAPASFSASARRIRHSLSGQHSTMKGRQKDEASRSSGLGCLLVAVRCSILRATSPRKSGLRASGRGWETIGCNASDRSELASSPAAVRRKNTAGTGPPGRTAQSRFFGIGEHAVGSPSNGLIRKCVAAAADETSSLLAALVGARQLPPRQLRQPSAGFLRPQGRFVSSPA